MLEQNQSNGSPVRQCPQPADSQPKFNLMEETYGSEWDKQSVDKYLSSSYCTIGKISRLPNSIYMSVSNIFIDRAEYANTFKLQQDHPCVIRLIRDNYIGQPAPKNVPYQMDHPETIDPSDGQSKEILRILKNLVIFLFTNLSISYMIIYFFKYRPMGFLSSAEVSMANFCPILCTWNGHSTGPDCWLKRTKKLTGSLRLAIVKRTLRRPV